MSLVDDLNGGRAQETLQFGLDGNPYEIDLSTANAAKLRDALAIYIAAGRRAHSRHGRVIIPGTRSTADRQHSRQIRIWARSRGLKISERGRIPSEVIEAFDHVD